MEKRPKAVAMSQSTAEQIGGMADAVERGGTSPMSPTPFAGCSCIPIRRAETGRCAVPGQQSGE